MRLLCLHCRETTEVDPEGSALTACPHCGSTSAPADADDQVTITLTVHELRILCIWASNYAENIKDNPGCGDSPRAVYGILDHLGTQTDTPLSMRQELADLRSALPNSTVTVRRADGTETDL